MEKIGEKEYKMIIGDNGKGSTITLEEPHTTFGMELIKMLIDQLHGKIIRLPQKGTVYQITFREQK